MADRILHSVAIKRDLVEGGRHATELQRLIAKFATASLYTHQKHTMDRLLKQILRKVAKDYYPLAVKVGHKAAMPILEGIGPEFLAKGSVLRGKVLKQLSKKSRVNLLVLRQELQAAAGELKGATQVAFAKAYQNGVARRQLIKDLVAADKESLAAIADARAKVDVASGRYARAEKALSKRPRSVRLRQRAIDARKNLRRAKANAGRRRDFLSRFETKVQGHVRDGMRRQAGDAQQAAYKQAGFGDNAVYTWVTVNGDDTCPDCSARHGEQHKRKDWPYEPRDGSTVCGGSCQCDLTPAAYTDDNPTLKEPLRI
ncbi:MAG: hypothetical protein KAV00_07170 [Phycisphaerae bacterium]|nr:hypothetical protein [Phycisphaerae bacterium]